MTTTTHAKILNQAFFGFEFVFVGMNAVYDECRLQCTISPAWYVDLMWESTKKWEEMLQFTWWHPSKLKCYIKNNIKNLEKAIEREIAEKHLNSFHVRSFPFQSMSNGKPAEIRFWISSALAGFQLPSSIRIHK